MAKGNGLFLLCCSPKNTRRGFYWHLRMSPVRSPLCLPALKTLRKEKPAGSKTTACRPQRTPRKRRASRFRRLVALRNFSSVPTGALKAKMLRAGAHPCTGNRSKSEGSPGAPVNPLCFPYCVSGMSHRKNSVLFSWAAICNGEIVLNTVRPFPDFPNRRRRVGSKT